MMDYTALGGDVILSAHKEDEQKVVSLLHNHTLTVDDQLFLKELSAAHKPDNDASSTKDDIIDWGFDEGSDCTGGGGGSVGMRTAARKRKSIHATACDGLDDASLKKLRQEKNR